MQIAAKIAHMLSDLDMSKRLLVVDDEPNLLRAVAACLRAEGYEVVTARSGADALMRVAERKPDLVVSDIRLPGMDGNQLARQIRSSLRTGLVPVVLSIPTVFIVSLRA